MVQAKRITGLRKKQAKSTVRELYGQGVPEKDIVQIVGVSSSTIHRWIKKDKEDISKISKPASPQAPAAQIRPMTMDEFVCMLSKLTNSYNEMKAELLEMRRSAEEWKCMAGRLNQQLQNAFCDK